MGHDQRHRRVFVEQNRLRHRHPGGAGAEFAGHGLLFSGIGDFELQPVGGVLPQQEEAAAGDLLPGIVDQRQSLGEGFGPRRSEEEPSGELLRFRGLTVAVIDAADLIAGDEFECGRRRAPDGGGKSDDCEYRFHGSPHLVSDCPAAIRHGS